MTLVSGASRPGPSLARAPTCAPPPAEARKAEVSSLEAENVKLLRRLAELDSQASTGVGSCIAGDSLTVKAARLAAADKQASDGAAEGKDGGRRAG